MGSSFWRNRIGSGPRHRSTAPGGRRRPRAWKVSGTVEGLEPRVVLASFIVTSAADDGAGSLREAIEQANRLPREGHTIEFSSSVGDTIVLAGPLPTVSVDIEIEGPGDDDDRLTIARSSEPDTPEFRIFTVAEGADLRLRRLVLTNGDAEFGGAILNEGTVGLDFTSVVGNRGRFKGGGIYNRGALYTYHARIEGNVVEGATTIGFGPAGIGRGGGIYNDGWASMTVSSVTGNRANREGGGLFNEGTFNIETSTFSNNVVEGFVLAGGLVPYGRGGAIYNAHTVKIDASTIAENRANRVGGGIFSNVIRGGSDRVNPYRIEDSTIRSSIVADNENGNLVVKTGTFLSQGNNLFAEGAEVAPQPTDLVGADPMLVPLGDYGGHSLTHPLLPGSPALDRGLRDPDFAFDQRGVSRPEGQADIGAFESGGFTLRAVSGGGQSALPGAAFAGPLTVSVEPADDQPVAGGVVLFSSPGSGASAVLASPTAIIGPSGLASVRATAGAVPGSYDVEATAGAGSGVSFALTNEGIPPAAEPSSVGSPTPASSASAQRPSPFRASSGASRALAAGRWGAIASRWGGPADRRAILVLLASRRQSA